MLKRTITSALLTSVITALIFGVVLFAYIDNFNTAYTYLSVDLDSSVAFELNKHNKVMSVSALNDSAENLALNQMCGVEVAAAINMLVKQDKSHEFIHDQSKLYITAIALKKNNAVHSEFQKIVTDDKKLKFSLSHVSMVYAESDIGHYKLAVHEHRSLKDYVDLFEYKNIQTDQVNLKGAIEYDKYFAAENSQAVLLEINKFIDLIESEQHAGNNDDFNFVSSIRSRLQVPGADYHDIYLEVVNYWLEFNKSNRMREIMSENTESSIIHQPLQIIDDQTIALGAVKNLASTNLQTENGSSDASTVEIEVEPVEIMTEVDTLPSVSDRISQKIQASAHKKQISVSESFDAAMNSAYHPHSGDAITEKQIESVANTMPTASDITYDKDNKIEAESIPQLGIKERANSLREIVLKSKTIEDINLILKWINKSQSIEEHLENTTDTVLTDSDN